MQPDSSQYGDGDNRLYRFDESGDPKGDSSRDEGYSESAANSQESSHPPLSEQEWQRLTDVARAMFGQRARPLKSLSWRWCASFSRRE